MVAIGINFPDPLCPVLSCPTLDIGQRTYIKHGWCGVCVAVAAGGVVSPHPTLPISGVAFESDSNLLSFQVAAFCLERTSQ